MLKLYEPSEDILPCEGMITIIPASRMHSAVYGGKTDRVMIGINFYSLLLDFYAKRLDTRSQEY